MNGRTSFPLMAAAATAVLVLGGCATGSPGYGSYPPSPYGSTSTYGSSNCYDCGTVTRIEQVTGGSSAPGATGAVLGGIVGAVAGHEISRHTGGSEGNQNVSAAVGAVGGAVAGNAIQKRTAASYNVYVRMNDGRTTVVTQNDLDGVREGSSVRVYNGRAWVR